MIIALMIVNGCASTNNTVERYIEREPYNQDNSKPFAYRQTNGWKVDNTNDASGLANYSDFCSIPIYCENEITFDEKYSPYYALLTDGEKEIYRMVYYEVTHLGNKLNFKNNIQLADSSFYKIDLAIGFDHPELFWYEKMDRVQHFVRYQGEAERHLDSVTYEFKYNDLANDLAGNQSILFNEVQKIVSLTRQFATAREKELFVHDYLLNHVEFVSGSDYNQTAYSALINHKTVCSGYTRAFQIIMRQLRIPAYFVNGYKVDKNTQVTEFSDADLHSWNLVLMDGKYYNVDVTNDYLSDVKNIDRNVINYVRFNRSDKDFADNGYYRRNVFDYSIVYDTNMVGIVHLTLPFKAASNDNVTDIITPERILKSLVAYYPDLPKNIVTTQEEFDRASMNQLTTGDSVYTLITNSKTYDKVSKYNWDQRNQKFIDNIEALRNVKAKSVSSTGYPFTDDIRLYVNDYVFK